MKSYGIKKVKENNNNKPIILLMNTKYEFRSPIFYGIGGSYIAKEYKSLYNAVNTARRFQGEVFEIIDGVMNY